jgi:hypothetical protein
MMVAPGVPVLTTYRSAAAHLRMSEPKGHQQVSDSSVVLDLTFDLRVAAILNRMSNSPHQCGGSEVRIIFATSPSFGLLNQSHTETISCRCSFESEVRKIRTPRNHANSGLGTLVVRGLPKISGLAVTAMSGQN